MPDMLDLKPQDNLLALFTGVSGSGKSVAIGSWLDKGSIYYFDFDGRMASVANWYKQRGLTAGQLTYDTYGPKNLYDAFTKLDSFLAGCPHAAVVIDSFTALTVSAVMYSLMKRKGKGGTAAPATTKGDMIIPDWDEYKGETVAVTTMLDMCKALAANGTAVFWTAHPIVSTRIEAGTDGSKDKYMKQTRYAAYGAKSDSLIPIYFNEVYHFTTEWDFSSESNKRWCFTQPEGTVAAKTAMNLPVKFDWTNKNFYREFSRLVEEGDAKAFGQTEESVTLG